MTKIESISLYGMAPDGNDHDYLVRYSNGYEWITAWPGVVFVLSMLS